MWSPRGAKLTMLTKADLDDFRPYLKAGFPQAIFFAQIDIFRRLALANFFACQLFYDHAKCKCQQVNMAAINVRHLVNLKINIFFCLIQFIKNI